MQAYQSHYHEAVLMILPVYFTELSPDFVKPLSNITIKERETAEFTAEVNKDGATVKWFIDNKEIEESDKFEIFSDGRTHKLIIKDAVLPDTGEVMAKVEGKTQKATLTVEGRCLLSYAGGSHLCKLILAFHQNYENWDA